MVHDDERRMVAAFRARTVPDSRTKDALLDRLLADAPEPAPAPAWRRIGIAAGLAIAIAAAVLLSIRGAVMLVAPSSQRADAEAVYDTTPTRSSEVPSTPTPAPSHDRTAPHAMPAAPAVDTPADSLAPAPALDKPAASDDALAQEAKLLARAQAAMRDGDPTRALAALAEHARRFPTGTMQLERDALVVIARCELDPTHAAAAHAVLADPRAAGYASRIRSACKL